MSNHNQIYFCVTHEPMNNDVKIKHLCKIAFLSTNYLKHFYWPLLIIKKKLQPENFLTAISFSRSNEIIFILVLFFYCYSSISLFLIFQLEYFPFCKWNSLVFLVEISIWNIFLLLIGIFSFLTARACNAVLLYIS